MNFDDALSATLTLLREKLGNQKTQITLVRDVTGQITAILERDALAADQWDNVAGALHDTLGPFSPGPTRVLLRKSDLIDEADIFDSPDLITLSEDSNSRLLDRLQSNQDWLRSPRVTQPRIPLAVGFSLKGGVGRSTALAILAWHLAREGKRVLAVDLDLEAPGLGSILLDELPDFGLVDWIVDALAKAPDFSLLQDCTALSPMASDSAGVVQVLPAFGRKTKDYVAKVGRVFFPGIKPDGSEIGFAEKLETLITAVSSREGAPDVLLLDARAGLNDVGAAAVTQLGAETFIFGRDDRQGWAAYKLLFEHLAKSKGLAFGMPDEDLRWRLKMVAAQLDKTEAALTNWVSASYDTWLALYDDDSKARDTGASAQIFERDELAAPHYPLPIYFDSGFRGVNLVDSGSRPTWGVVESAFGVFLKSATERLFPAAEPQGMPPGQTR